MMGASMTLFDPFIINILIAAIGIAILTGTMGCFVVWRRMAYFGDALSHSALLGIALGIITGVQMPIAVMGICSLFALLLVYLQHQKILSSDTLLGILAHGALAFGMVAFSFLNQNIDLHAFLFGDILTIRPSEIYWIYIGGAIVISLVYYSWSSLLLTTLSEELAASEGIKTTYINLLFMFLMTLIVALSMRIIGVLLITSLLIIPAATARHFANSPVQMVFGAIGFGIISAIFGILASLFMDIPASPAIISSAVIIFIISTFFHKS